MLTWARPALMAAFLALTPCSRSLIYSVLALISALPALRYPSPAVSAAWLYAVQANARGSLSFSGCDLRQLVSHRQKRFQRETYSSGGLRMSSSSAFSVTSSRRFWFRMARLSSSDPEEKCSSSHQYTYMAAAKARGPIIEPVSTEPPGSLKMKASAVRPPTRNSVMPISHHRRLRAVLTVDSSR